MARLRRGSCARIGNFIIEFDETRLTGEIWRQGTKCQIPCQMLSVYSMKTNGQLRSIKLKVHLSVSSLALLKSINLTTSKAQGKFLDEIYMKVVNMWVDAPLHTKRTYEERAAQLRKIYL